MWTEAIGRMQKRMEDTRRRVGSAYPHWADPETGAWTTTADGDLSGPAPAVGAQSIVC